MSNNAIPKIAKHKLSWIAIALLIAVSAWLRPQSDDPLGSDTAPFHESRSVELDSNQPAGPSQFSSSERSGNSIARIKESRSTDAGAAADLPEKSLQTRPEGRAGDRESHPLYGLLTEVGPQRFLSPAGIIYTPGSQQGHRLEHLRRHVEDDPERPGSHGVFDGQMRGALETIDQAYAMAKRGRDTRTQIDGDRTVHTVNLRRRVGFVGGRSGANRGHPAANRVRIVLEENRFITAYPL